MTTTTATINDRLVELGTLHSNKDKMIQRKGASLVDGFFMSFSGEADDETVTDVLHYLTDIQVRDYALGILPKYDLKRTMSALQYLLDKAPTDTAFISAPASLLATYLFEQGDTASALVTLSNAQQHYSYAMLLRHVIQAGWASSSFAALRESTHDNVVNGIFGEEK